MKKYFTFSIASLILFCSLQAMANPCDSIKPIICGTPITFAPATGLGDANFSTTTACGGSTTQGGLENIYKFIAPSTGTYQLNVTTVANANSVKYGYKTATNCNHLGWNCLKVMTTAGILGAINLNAGDSIFILANARTTSTTSQTFQINCSTTYLFENEKHVSLFSLYPNPFSIQTTLKIDNLLKNATLTVYNSFGQTVKQIKNISGQTLYRIQGTVSSHNLLRLR